MIIRSDRKAFRKLEDKVKPHEITGRTPSAAFLIWFLQTIYRLDEDEAIDGVCDNSLDAGVDALYTDDSHQELVLFQAKRKAKLPGTLGDKELRVFIGSLARFSTEDEVRRLASTTTNAELKRLLEDNKVAEKIGQGYAIRPILLSNVAADDNAKTYIETIHRAGQQLVAWSLNSAMNCLSRQSGCGSVGGHPVTGDQPCTVESRLRSS